MPTYDKIIGRNIRNARNAKKLTQAHLAEKIGVSTAYVGKWERGERSINLERLVELVSALGVPIESFVSGCVFVEPLLHTPDEFLSAVEELTKGCTQKAKKLILEVIAVIAKNDKENA